MNIVAEIDAVAETSDQNPTARNLDRVVFLCVLIMVIAAPHSIAATQTGWLVGTAAWLVRMFVRPRPSFKMSIVGVWLIAFLAWSVFSSALSYEPAVSIDKLRGVGVLFIFFLVLNVVRNRRAVYLLSFLLIGSCMISVAWTPFQKLIGRGVQISDLRPEGPLAARGVKDGDVIVRANRVRVNSPEAVIASFDDSETVNLEMHRLDGVFHIQVPTSELLYAQTASESLGFGSWVRGRGFRAAGFYGHYTTFAEVLQLIGALAFGLFVAAFMAGVQVRKTAALGACVLGIVFALLLTVTRASQLGFVISSAAIVLFGASRKFLLVAVAVAIPAGALGLYLLQQQRHVGFFDPKDESTKWRQMMWRDGARLLVEDPRHLIVGVGMDSIKNRWMEWGFFDKGWQPMGHFHSTPLQLAVERGIPALLIWLGVLAAYARTLWRGLKNPDVDWRSRGILLGCGGGLIGFFVSGLVHYNLGDQEVAMVFYILMGLAVRLTELPAAEDMIDADSTLLQA